MRVLLGPFAYEVTDDREGWAAVEDKRGSAFGYTSHTEQRIYLQPGLHSSMWRAVLLHEVMHAAAFASGLHFDEDHSEEEWVLRVAPPLLDALQRTEGLFEALTLQ